MKTLIALVLFCITAFAQSDRQQFIRTDAPVIALTHVRIIDGTGAAPLEDQTIVIAGGKIQSIGATIPEKAHVLDLKGYTVLPGLVGMHNHLFFPMGGSPPMYSNMGTSFPRLYLALGVTTIRTTGSVAPYTDLEIKRLIDSGRMIGPKMHVTAPYLEGVGSFTPVMHELQGPDDARRLVNFWADQGATSFKAYMKHQSRRAARGRRGSAQARAQGHRPSLLNRLSRSGRDWHRQPRAWPARRLGICSKQTTG